jgi:Putative Actinobacterial Holin-X, holin superfamily III
MADSIGVDAGSMTEIIKHIFNDVQEIIRAEFRLAKAEVTEKAQRVRKGSAMLGGAAICGFFGGACLVVTCIAALALAMPVWLAALIMAICLSVAAGAMFAAGRTQMREVDPVPQETVQTLKDDVQWAKQRVK